MIRFHDIQEKVTLFRKQRIADLKLVYPSISNAHGSFSRDPTKVLDSTKSQRKESSKSDKFSRQKITASYRNIDGLSNSEVTEGVRNTHHLVVHCYCSIVSMSTAHGVLIS